MPDDKAPPPTRPVRARIADVARAAGVHPSTVSRVLRADGPSRISTDVADRIRALAQELGYSANPMAAGMRTRSTRSIGLIVHDIKDPVYPPILEGIERRMNKAGYMVVLGNTGYSHAAELAMLDQMTARMMDGIILGTTRRRDPVADRARALGVPIVSVLRQTDDGLCSAAVNDCAAGMVAVTQAVIAHGHRDIAVIGAPQDLSTGRDRLEGVTATLATLGAPLKDDRLVFVPRMDVDEGRLAMQTLLARRPSPPDAVIAVNDLVAIGVLQACRAAGLHCPRDISVTGYNDIPLLDMLDPPLTSVSMDLQTIGARAATLLLEHFADPNMPARIDTVAPDLRLRSSLARRG